MATKKKTAPKAAPKEEAKLEAPAPQPKDESTEPRITSDGEGGLPTEGKAAPEDYLRQYQYRKQTQPGSVGSDPEPGSKAAIMKAKLLAQPRVRILIPRPQGEKKSIDYSVTLNGYRIDIPKNVYIDLPQQVADIIMDSQQQTEAAILRGQISGDSRKEAEFNR